MMRQRLAAGLLVLLLLAPTALAADPVPLWWSPYNAQVGVTGISLAAEGTTVGAALAALPLGGGGNVGTVPRVVTSDLSILDTGTGWIMNGTGTSQTPPGRTHVAVSRDGSTIASLGNDTNPNARPPEPPGGLPDDPTNPPIPGSPTASDSLLRLSYQRAPAGANFSQGRAANHTVVLDGYAAGLLLSDDGRHVVVATNDGPRLTVRGFTLTPNGLASSFVYRLDGNVTGIAASGDLGRVYASARLSEGNLTRGVLLLIPYSTGAAVSSFVDRSADNTTFRNVVSSRDGNRVLVGTGDGRLLLFQPAGNVLGEPQTATVGGPADAVGPIAISSDGTRAAAASAARTLTHYDLTVGMRSIWSAATPTPATLAYNRTGGLLLAGASDGLTAYGDADSGSLWRVAGDARSVSVNAAGDLLVIGRSSLILGMALARNVSIEHVGGSDTAPAKLVRPGGTVTWDLNVRNHGATPENLRLESAADPTFRLAFEPATVYLKPGETRRVTVTAEADRAFERSRTFNVSAVALTSNVRDETTLSMGLLATANVSFIADVPPITATPGETSTILLGVQNRGLKDASVGIRARQTVTLGAPWDVAVDPASFVIAPTSLTTVRVDVTPPANAPNGTSVALTLTLEGQDVSDSVTIQLRINPNVGLEIDASVRTKFVQPGAMAHYNVTVKNTGSLPRLFEAYYDLVPAEGGAARAWSVDMPIGEFSLNAGDARTIPVRILAPRDVTPSDHVAVRITARVIPLNDTEAPVAGNVTLFARGAAPVPEEDDPDDNLVPGPGIALVGALIATAALLRRRRRA